MADKPVLFGDSEGGFIDAWGNRYAENNVDEAEVDPQTAALTNSTNADLTGNITPDGETPDEEDELEDDEEETGFDLDTAKGDELRAELARRLAAGREIDATGVKKVSELRELLRTDDEAAAEEE